MTTTPSNGGKTCREEKCKVFERFARWNSRACGHPVAFGLALMVIVGWGLTGPLFHFSDTWQLVINTATTVVTFLMVFLIQNSQNRDNLAIQLKLDEVLRAVGKAHNSLLNVEELSQEELELLKKRYESLAQQARINLEKGKSDLGCPDVKGRQTAQKSAAPSKQSSTAANPSDPALPPLKNNNSKAKRINGDTIAH